MQNLGNVQKVRHDILKDDFELFQNLKDRHSSLLVIPVKTGIQNPQIKNPGFLLEFIPMKIGAGMTNLDKLTQSSPF